MDIKQLKQATQQLPRVDHLLDRIKKEHAAQQFLVLHKPLKELAYGQVINDKLASFAHHLLDLRIAHVTKDKEKAQRIVSMLLRDPHSSVKQLLADVQAFDAQVSFFHDSYHRLLEDTVKNMSLEDSIPFLEKNATRELRKIPKQQKEYLRMLGKHFVEMTKN